MTELRGINVANAINEKIIEDLKGIKGAIPRLAIVRVGERADDLAYERGALKKMEKLGLRASLHSFPLEITNDEFIKEFDKINEDEDVDGILMLRPLPKHLDERAIENRINPSKDIDGISPANLYKIFVGDKTAMAPCTARAVIEILKFAGIDLAGKKVTVIGRSLVIGRPVAMMLLKENATVTICHTKTLDMAKTAREADIVVAAAGVSKMIDASFVGEGATVIDVGINLDEDGKLCGDVDFEAVKDKVGIITPVPGGVGSVTTSVLAMQLVKAAKLRRAN